jgi:phospholipase C
MSGNSGSQKVRYVFVLMLENRSFDHMLGFSGISGADAATGQPTRINGLAGTESNAWNGAAYAVSQPAGYAMPLDPPHEFPDVLEQLCGAGASYAPGGAYPAIDNSGFVASYAAGGGQANPAEIMRCFSPAQLPVLNALAAEFAVCDNWYSSMPGPTWPNRFFVHAATSSGLDHSPTIAEIVLWESLAGFVFNNGSIFDRMNASKVAWRIYAGDAFPLAAALKGIQLTEVHPYGDFAGDVAAAGYPSSYTFIEPSYNVLTDYRCSTSQHPLDDVTRGEVLIRCTYEAIRNSPLWSQSLLIVAWDEHGGFYDHVAPPRAAAPGDTGPSPENSQYGFTFDQYGPRVPGVAISPWIPRNLVDHRVYDHTSILATLEALFGLHPLTQRDASANSLVPLLSLADPRSDAPASLPPAADSGLGGCPPVDCGAPSAQQFRAAMPQAVARPRDTVNEGNLPGVLQTALRSDLALSPPQDRNRILVRVSALKTRAEARRYIEGVSAKIRAAKP